MLKSPVETVPREAFWPRSKLKRSVSSNAEKRVLYSANLSRQFGKGARIGLFVAPECLPIPYPATADVMIWLDAQPPGRVGALQRHLISNRTVSGPVRPLLYRFESAECTGEKVSFMDSSGAFGKVWLPPAMFNESIPAICWIDLQWGAFRSAP